MIVVLGAAGTIGRHVASFLEEWGAEIARRDFRFEGEEHVDARNAASLAGALSGAGVVVNCADYRLNLDVMRGALAAGAHYVDLGGLFHVTRQQLELDDEFRDAGLTAILGIGSAPGKTNLLASAAARRLAEDPVSMEIWAATRDPAAADHPFPAPYSVQTLRDELQMGPMVVRDGELTEVEPLSGESERDFPAPVGRAKGIYTLHSELATLPVSFPSSSRGELSAVPFARVAREVARARGGRASGAVRPVAGVGRRAPRRTGRRRLTRRRDDRDAGRKREVDLGACGPRGARARRGQARARRACGRPSRRSTTPRRSSALLDTEVRWQGP